MNEDDDVIPHLAPLVAVPGAGPHVSCRQLHRLIFLVTEERADILNTHYWTFEILSKQTVSQRFWSHSLVKEDMVTEL